MAAPESVRALAERFARNRDAYRSGQYKETQLRREFVDPLFEALGWDVANRQGFAEAYKDVVHEDAIKIEGASEAPDYCFRIGGTRKFFVETKKPSVNVKDDTHPAYQLRRYAWSAKLPLSVLTDFEELAVYDCRVRPFPKDKAAVARILLLGFEQYDERWEEIASIFSREAVLKGSFDRYAESGKRRGTAEVDAAFLRDIESWRDLLARNIALRNPRLSQRDLNLAVQSTIDRIIFLRICEDRSIEDYGRLRALLSGTNVYERLLDLFRRADDRYNSGLFHFKKERGRPEPPDELAPTLVIDDKTLKEILGGLYYPESPYEFSVLPADILGQVYEQFLGKVIRLTAGHQAKVEDKPEVKKAGGVFYTPTYIVDHIVKNTVGKLLEGKTPRQVSKLRVLDPACGSGSFLIGAYQRLLDWHRDRYVEDGPGKHPKELYEGPGGDWRLTTAERKQILLNNIFGVDIDPQAVEVTKLSLLLKVLEGETGETFRRQHSFIPDRALPDLASNIKCGNSLVGTDFYSAFSLLDRDVACHNRVNAFDWAAEFPESLRLFHAVIGNPPYVLLQVLDQPDVFEYLGRMYSTARYKVDTYQVFLEKGLRLTATGGYLGFITPNSFLRNKHARFLRRFILASSEIVELQLFGYPVFKGASVDTATMILRRRSRPSQRHVVQVFESTALGSRRLSGNVPQRTWAEHPEEEFGTASSAAAANLLTTLPARSVLLGSFATAYFGIQTHNRTTFVHSKPVGHNCKPVVDGVNISRYHLAPPCEYLDYRPAAIKSGGKRVVHESDRIGVRQIGESPVATFIPGGVYALNTIYNIFFVKPTSYSLLFVLGVISSRLVRWYWRECFFDHKRTFPKIKKKPLLSILIPIVNWDRVSDRNRHDRLVGLVRAMLALRKKAGPQSTDHSDVALDRRLSALDREIDHLVYELYGLTDKEIRIVEEAVP